MAERQTRRIVKSLTILGHEVAKFKELVYVDEEQDELDKKTKKLVRQAAGIPRELRRQAESLVSSLYGDARQYWNPERIGDLQSDAPGHNVAMGITQTEAGQMLAARAVKPSTLLHLANMVFCTPMGENDKNFQAFLELTIRQKMGLPDEEGK